MNEIKNARERLLCEIMEYLDAKECSAEEKAVLVKNLTAEAALQQMEFLCARMDHSRERSPLLRYAETCPIEMLGFSGRTYNALTSRYGAPQKRIATVADLLRKTDRELMDYRNIGAGSMAEIREKRAAFLEQWERDQKHL